MTSSQQPDTFAFLREVLDDWKKQKERALSDDATRFDVEMYRDFCKMYFVEFSKLYLRYEKAWTKEICKTIFETAKQQLGVCEEKLKSMPQ